MSYNKLWKLLDNSLKDLKKSEEIISTEVLRDLRSANTLIQIFKADPSHLEILPQIEAYLEKVEAFIVYSAQHALGQEYVDAFMEKIKKVRENIYKKERVETTPTSRFIAGLPRNKHWMRIHVSDEIPQEEVADLAEKDGLSFKMQDDNYALISGDKEIIKLFVRKMATKLSLAS